MRVLMLTWEFPPVITGGLGMACYGMAKALLGHGVEVDLIMPAKQAVYFPLRKPEHADDPPLVFANPSEQAQLSSCAADMKKLVGNPLSVYFSLGHGSGHSYTHLRSSNPTKRVLEIISDKSYVFRQVQHFTDVAVDTASDLKFDIIHAHDWLTYPAGMILKKLTGRPLITHVHATEFDRAGGPGDGRIHDIEYMGMEYADKVIAVSDYTSKTVVEKYRTDPQKIAVVHNAYSMPNSRNNHRRIFKDPTVLFMGRITLQKGPDYFLEVARRVLQREKKVRFLMAGSGDMERQVLHRSAYLGLGTRFLVAGFLSRQEVEDILAATDIFVLPSVSEPFGIAPLEAMSHGAVAIVSKNSGVAEIIQNAYKVDFWDIDKMVDIIVDLIRNPAKLAEMSIKGRAEVAKLQWEDAAGKLLDVFHSMEEVLRCSA